MVVGITLATIAYFMTRSSSASFIDLDGLRKTLKKEVGDEGRRAAALELVDALNLIIDEYDRFLRTSLDRYLVLAQGFDTSASQVIDGSIRPVWEKRRTTLLSLIDLRSQLRELLTEKELELVAQAKKAREYSFV